MEAAPGPLFSDDVLARVLKSRGYGEFRRRLSGSDCRRCPLWAGRARIVVDRGNPRARVLAVGEAPGETEDREGRAFVGRAGRTLDRVMASAGLDTNRHMLIANVAKCRPPGNRPPSRQEAEACLPYLRRQMELLRPRLVLLLGATALRRLDPSKKNFSMAQETGRWFSLDGFPGPEFMVLYHPAALLYNARLVPEMERHARAVRNLMEERGLLT
jgi:uracil-DNA glycosylase